MSNDIRGWLGSAMTAVSLLVTLWAGTGRRSRRIERFCSFKAWRMEWTAREREDDTES
jgi:hypothetical protein